jgi:hypothetical protein
MDVCYFEDEEEEEELVEGEVRSYMYREEMQAKEVACSSGKSQYE